MVPILILLVLGIIEFGWLFNAQITLTSAAREGARVAVVNDDPAVVKGAIKNHIEGVSGFQYAAPGDQDYYGSLSQLKGAPLTSPKAGAAVEDTGNDVTVYIRGMYKPLVGMFVGDPKELWGRTVMRKE